MTSLCLRLILVLVSLCKLSAQGIPGIGGVGLVHAQSSGAAAAFKTLTRNEATGTGTTIATSSTMNVATNDFLVACVGNGDGITRTVTGITDGGSNAFTFLKQSSTATSAVGTVEMWYKAGATANATATFTATYNLSAPGPPFRSIQVANYSGMATSSPTDQSSCNAAACTTSTNANSITAQNVTTTQANELLAACVYTDSNANYTAAGSYNMRDGVTAADIQYADKIVSATGSHPNGNIATVSVTLNYLSVFGTFKSN